MKKNKIIGLSIGILIVLIIVVSSTYAYWQITRTQETPNDIVAACLNLDLEDASAAIDLDSAWPISDEEGKELTGYTFTVTNNCNEEINYIVGLNRVEEENYLQDSSIKLQLDDNSTFLYSDLSDVEYVDPDNTEYTSRVSKQVSVETIGASATNTHTIRIWVSDEAPVTEQSKTFQGQVFITGGQGIEAPNLDNCFTIGNNGVILGYNLDCGTNLVVPAEINGIQVKEINHFSFDTNETDVLMYDTEYLDENNEGQQEIFLYFKSTTYKDEIEDGLKQMLCEDAESCSLDDYATIFYSLEEYNAFDWSRYDEVIARAAMTYDESTEELLELESYNLSIYQTVDLSDAIYLETIGQYTFYGNEISVNSGSYNGECEGKTIINENTSAAHCVLGELADLKLPQNGSLEIIGENAFANNLNLTEISLPNTIKTIGNSAFNNNNLTKVIIPSSVRTIGYDAFYNNPNLTEVIIKNTEENINVAYGAFPSTTTVIYNPNYAE